MVDMVNELDGKVAIVTGSARNIGRATAEELARAGAALVINSVQAKDLCEEVVEGIRAACGKAIPFMADVRDPDAVNAMAAAANKEFGGIAIMLHNAARRVNHVNDQPAVGDPVSNIARQLRTIGIQRSDAAIIGECAGCDQAPPGQPTVHRVSRDNEEVAAGIAHNRAQQLVCEQTITERPAMQE